MALKWIKQIVFVSTCPQQQQRAISLSFMVIRLMRLFLRELQGGVQIPPIAFSAEVDNITDSLDGNNMLDQASGDLGSIPMGGGQSGSAAHGGGQGMVNHPGQSSVISPPVGNLGMTDILSGVFVGDLGAVGGANKQPGSFMEVQSKSPLFQSVNRLVRKWRWV